MIRIRLPRPLETVTQQVEYDQPPAALIVTVVPGDYTGIVRGKGDNTGVALVEVFHVQ